MFEGLRRRWRFRNLEQRIETAEARVADAEDNVADRKHWHESFGGRHEQILEAERRLKKAEETHRNLIRLQIERDSF